ncbi:MAG: gephyrin-like molybdotransferase Glp [Pseudomonadota bacterium]
MRGFQSFAVIDWSSANDTGSKPRADAIWAALVVDGKPEDPVYLRNRDAAMEWLEDLIRREIAADRRLMIGFDFPFGYPAGFAQVITGRASPLDLWDWYAASLEDTPRGNNRFALAGQMNALFPGDGPFWFNGLKADVPNLPRRKPQDMPPNLAEDRQVETRAKGSFSCWQMGGAGAVGGQIMTGMACLAQLREAFPNAISVWPFEPLNGPVAFAEIWPSLVKDAVIAEEDTIRDRAQVLVLARALARLSDAELSKMLDVSAPEEGWILGVGYEDTLRRAARQPRGGDCYALPPGVAWMSVDEAADRLRRVTLQVSGTELVPIFDAVDRVLSKDMSAKRDNPPAANVAVDGWAFAHDRSPGGLICAPKRAAPGVPYKGALKFGCAVRVLTGALLPSGADTVALDEECRVDGDRVYVPADAKLGANVRRRGEDIRQGDVALEAGSRLRPQDLALLAATGHHEAEVVSRLRVGVLSTGDELVDPKGQAGPERTYDANRPMLLSLCTRWGFAAVDLGIVSDARDALRHALDRAATEVDILLTSGGASAGDEDHVSSLLSDEGQVHAWRIAIKPGRPLALGQWGDLPVFGLPGNPVAAFVCALLFARPAMLARAGCDWSTPEPELRPAAFIKRKKAGRREYLRARLDEKGQVAVFPSEGSGRITGLSWAEGLVELPDQAVEIRTGDPVTYIPFSAFGL